jgi:hypothetical protein
MRLIRNLDGRVILTIDDASLQEPIINCNAQLEIQALGFTLAIDQSVYAEAIKGCDPEKMLFDVAAEGFSAVLRDAIAAAIARKDFIPHEVALLQAQLKYEREEAQAVLGAALDELQSLREDYDRAFEKSLNISTHP